MNSFHVRPGSVQLVLGKPIPSAGMKPRDMEKMAQQVHEVIAEEYYSRARVTRPTPANNEGNAKEKCTDYPVGLQHMQGDENQRL
jgi:hypothetical protein